MKIFQKVIFVLALAASLAAQQPAKDTADQSAKKEVLAGGDGNTGNFFKLALVMYEFDDGKRTNQRDYTMIARAENPPSSIKVSTRVPITTEERGKDKAYTYIDAGLIIRCSMKEQVDRRVQLHCDIEMSSFLRPEQIASSGNNIPLAPVLRSTRTESWALLTLGKPAALTTIDDVNSNKRMQVEVTATKVD